MRSRGDQGKSDGEDGKRRQQDNGELEQGVGDEAWRERSVEQREAGRPPLKQC